MMKDKKVKQLKKLNRKELLELLLLQTRENEKLKAELSEVQAALDEKNLRIEKAGDLATAMIAVNGVMEAAQAAAEQYLENIKKMERQAAEKYGVETEDEKPLDRENSGEEQTA